VYEWQNRIKLCLELTSDNNEEEEVNNISEHALLSAIKVYTDAIKAIDSNQAFGKASEIWIDFAYFYEQYGEEGGIE